LMSDEPEAAAVFRLLRPVQAFNVIALFHIPVFYCSVLIFGSLHFLPESLFAAEPPILHGDGFLKSP